MTEEQRAKRREYRRQWAKDHPDTIRQYRQDRLRRQALAAILAERKMEVSYTTLSDGVDSGQNMTKAGDTA